MSRLRHSSAPRRPPGWIAPGPPPRGAAGRPDLEPGPDEELSYLAGDWRLFQKRRGHRWSLDDLVTAAVAAEEAEPLGARRILDLGCGQGSVLLLMAWRFPEAQLWGIEAQVDRAAMARRSVAYNGVEDRVRVMTADFRSGGALGDLTELPIITGTPPYFPLGTGTESEHAHARPCRFELRGGLEAYLEVARDRLAPEGRLVLANTALARGRIERATETLGLHLARRLEVIPREGKAPLIVVDVFARARAPSSASVGALVVRDRALQWTPEFRALRDQFGIPSRPP